MSRNVQIAERLRRAIAPPAPKHDDFPPIRWWEVLLGGVGVAVCTFAMIWAFAILGFALEGAP